MHAVFHACEQQSRKMLDEDEGASLVSLISDALTRDLTGLNDRLKGKTVDQKLRSLANLLVSSKLVGQANVVKHGSDYELYIEACKFALTMQKHESGMTRACPWGIVASSIASRASGRHYHPKLSTATDTGTSTRIQLQEDLR